MILKGNGMEWVLMAWSERQDGIEMWFDEPLTDAQEAAIIGGQATLFSDDGEPATVPLPKVTGVSGYGYLFTAKTAVELAVEAATAEAEAERDKLQEEKAAIQAIAAAAFTDEQAKEHADIWEAWQAKKDYKAGLILTHGGTLYRVEQAHTSQAHQPPDAAGMLAVYRPIQAPPEDGKVLPWVSGEAGVQKGDKRSFGGKVYEAIQSPGANIWEPPTVAAIWKEVKN